MTRVNVLSGSGSINFNANSAGGTFTTGGVVNLGSATGTDVTASTAAVTITADKPSFAATATINSTGAVVVEPYGASFGAAVSTANLDMNGISGLRMGVAGNTAAIGLDRALSVAGHVTVYGGNVNGAYGISLGNGYALTVDNSGNSSVLSGVISGTGVSVSKLGAGVLTLTGNNTYTGGTSIDTGSTLVAGNAATSGLLGTGAITNNGVLSFKRSDAISVADIISGTGIVKQEGSGTLTLSATNTYEGGTQVNAGTLAISTDRNVGAVPSTFDADNVLLNGGALRFMTGFTTLHANRGITLGTGNGTLSTDASVSVNYSGVIAGTGGLTKSGSGTLTLTNVQTYTGTTTISGGTLNVGDGSDALAALSANTLSIGSGATLNFNHNADTTVANAISGAGQLNRRYRRGHCRRCGVCQQHSTQHQRFHRLRHGDD
jgi:autotransporter-associated beta strand protein